jgi:hypothetical protein
MIIRILPPAYLIFARLCGWLVLLGRSSAFWRAAAVADYRARRRAGGRDEPRAPKVRDTDGHIPAHWFRYQIWLPARRAAGLGNVRVHDLRHAHASWWGSPTAERKCRAAAQATAA